MLTFCDLEAMERETISPSEAAEIIGCNPQFIRIQARQDRKALGFPVIVMGHRVRIPRRAFLAFLRGDLQDNHTTERDDCPCREMA